MLETDSLVVSGGNVNEDLVRFQGDAVVILDGATGLTERTITDAPTDGRWYVEALAEELTARLDSDDSLTDIAATAVTALAERYEDHSGLRAVESHEQPSAAGVILRWNRSQIEYLVLGDCSVVFETDSGTRSILGEGPRELDKKVVEEMVAIRDASEEQIGYESLRSQVHSMIVDHRKQKNEPDGYWTFGLDPEAVDHAEAGSVSTETTEFVYGFTDGFEPVCTTYDAFADWSTLATYLRTNGPNRAIRILRAFEEADPECLSYPRLKPSDDVGIATLDFTL
jgi:hypothetical protein